MVRMSDSDRPRFDVGTESHIEAIKNQADTLLWGQLEQFLSPTSAKERTLRQQYPASFNPPLPKKPMLLLSVITSYARTLYFAEENLYEQGPQVELWLRKLAEHIVERAMNIVASVEEAVREVQLTLQYHGLTSAQMREAAFDELNALIKKRLSPGSDREASDGLCQGGNRPYFQLAFADDGPRSRVTVCASKHSSNSKCCEAKDSPFGSIYFGCEKTGRIPS
jgi:hypothetical protein